jgi:hypothetical protein
MDQNQRTAAACGDDVDTDDCLANAGRRDKHTDIVCAQRVRRRLLHTCQCALKLELN